MSNGTKKDGKDVEEANVADVSGGYLPPGDAYLPLPIDGNLPYPRVPGGPIVIEPPVKPDLD